MSPVQLVSQLRELSLLPDSLLLLRAQRSLQDHVPDHGKH